MIYYFIVIRTIMRLYIASDHGGFALKNELISQLEQEDLVIVDLGPYELNPEDDYPDYALKVAEAVSKEDGAFGALICRSGNGMNIAANKIKGAYAAVCMFTHHAEMSRRDDNANIICLDADYGGDSPLEILKTFIKTEFAGFDTKYGRRFKKIQDIEIKNINA